MQIQDFFINGDMKGAIAYMREHEEFGGILDWTGEIEK